MPQGSEQGDAAIARLQEIVDAAEKEVARLMSQMSTSKGSLTSSEEAIANNRAVASQVRAAIAKLADASRAVGVAAAKPATASEASRLGLTLDPAAQTIIDTVVEDRLKEISGVWGDAADEVARATRVAITTSGSIDTLVLDVQGKMRGTLSQAQSAVDSMAMAAGRQVTVIQAEDAAADLGEDVAYVYGGPADRITRPFCRRHLTSTTRQVYTLAALDALDAGAGQPGPVSAYMGGYNCRHNLSPISIAEAKRAGYTVIR
jgi:hypothetical protein